MSQKKFHTYIDLFAGCGGLSLGLYNSGAWKGLFAIEKDPMAFETLKYNLINKKNHFNWPEWLPIQHHEINQLIRKYKNNLDKLQGKIDLVTGGPPCQGFSTAGLRNESDDRNKLINSYLKFIKLVKPKIIFFENVKGFTLKFKKNKTKGIAYSAYIVKVLNELNYEVSGKMINFVEYGIPQKRNRFVLVGVRKDIGERSKLKAEDFFNKMKENREDFLVNKGLRININLEEAISDLLRSNGEINSPDSKNFKAGKYSKPISSYQRIMRTGYDEDLPDSHRFANHRKPTKNKFRYIIKNSCRNKDISQKIKKKFKIKKHTVILLDNQEPCPTLTTLPDDYIHYIEPRILTVREYARIQSFNDWYKIREKYTTGGKMRVKETPRYTQVGNAIPPLFGEQSGLVLMQFIS